MFSWRFDQCLLRTDSGPSLAKAVGPLSAQLSCPRTRCATTAKLTLIRSFLAGGKKHSFGMEASHRVLGLTIDNVHFSSLAHWIWMRKGFGTGAGTSDGGWWGGKLRSG
jgi:hypothetical protein